MRKRIKKRELKRQVIAILPYGNERRHRFLKEEDKSRMKRNTQQEEAENRMDEARKQ